MQVRAAVGLAAFFLVIAVGAVALSMTAAAPVISVDQPDHSLSVNDEFTIGDRTYTLTSIDDESATLEWLNPEVAQSTTWDNGSTVDYQNVTYEVGTDEDASPPTVTLTEVLTVPEEYDVIEINESEYVVDPDDPSEVTPIDEFLQEYHGEPAQLVFALDETLEYEGHTATVTEITAAGAVLEWTTEEIQTVGVDHGQLTVLGPDDQQVEMYGHIEGTRLLLTADLEGYEAQVNAVDRHFERLSALWGVSLISTIAAGTLLALAFLPVRRT